MENEDLFKPLYKKHKRIKIENLEDVFDPRETTQDCIINNFALKKTGNTWLCNSLPGLKIIPEYLDSDTQVQLTKESLWEFLENPEHLTNLDAHYDLERPLTLFHPSASSRSSCVNDKGSFLVRDKIRWVTLGGQYNWTTKEYPSFEPGTPGCPQFPDSMTKLISSEFGINAQAAIVNFYKEGDILSPHQDVAELSRQDLLSVSLGCDCIFYISQNRYDTVPLALLLRSGDVVIMGGESRMAYHGVGRVFPASSPEFLCEITDFDDNEFYEWMSNHRININVRQMQ